MFLAYAQSAQCEPRHVEKIVDFLETVEKLGGGARLSEMVVHRAEREVIVCGGAYNSPQLLMLSGLGRPEELEQLKTQPPTEPMRLLLQRVKDKRALRV